MPDFSGGIATGLWWVARGKTPIEDLQDEEGEEQEEEEAGYVQDPQTGQWVPVGQQGGPPPGGAWGGGRGFGK